jgi:hypothetical protein
MRFLKIDEIKAADDLKSEEVEVPEWGGKVIVRMMTGRERDAFEASVMLAGKKPNYDNLRARLVALTVIDEEGNRLFSEKDIEWLGQKSAAALEKIFDVSQRLNAIREQDVEDLLGN